MVHQEFARPQRHNLTGSPCHRRKANRISRTRRNCHETHGAKKPSPEELELHESTISRVTTQKYMHTPNGIVEFKHFFSSHVSTEEGGECSSTAIRAFIKELVSNENPGKAIK